jgi:hypothetical protein
MTWYGEHVLLEREHDAPAALARGVDEGKEASLRLCERVVVADVDHVRLGLALDHRHVDAPGGDDGVAEDVAEHAQAPPRLLRIDAADHLPNLG